MEWVKEKVKNAEGEWIVEKFPPGHPAEGKERARYLIKPSKKYLDKLALEKTKEIGEERRIEITKDYIQKSYQEGHYVEAIVLAHYIIEVKMNMTFIAALRLFKPFSFAPMERMKVQRRKRSGKSPLYPLSTYKFLIIANILLDMGIYNSDLFNKLEKFNTYRNSVTHRLFEKLPNKKELNDYFELGMELWEETQKLLEGYNRASFNHIKKIMEKPPAYVNEFGEEIIRGNSGNIIPQV